MSDSRGTGGKETDRSDFVAVGRVASAWGHRGEIKVEVQTDSLERLAAGSQVYIQGEPFSIERSHRHKSCLLIQLDKISSREEAEALRGQSLEVPRGAIPPLPPDHYYYFEIVGLKVWTTGGEYLGEVTSVLPTGANDVYVVDGPRGQTLIPAIEDVVKAVEVDKSRMVIEPMPGMLK